MYSKRNKHTNKDLFPNLINGHSPHVFEHVPISIQSIEEEFSIHNERTPNLLIVNNNKQIWNNPNSAISLLASLAEEHILFHLKDSFWFHQTSVQEWTRDRLEAWVCWKMLYLGNAFQLIQSTKNTEECAGVTWSNYLLPRKAGKLIQSSWIRDRRLSSADKSL